MRRRKQPMRRVLQIGDYKCCWDCKKHQDFTDQILVSQESVQYLPQSRQMMRMMGPSLGKQLDIRMRMRINFNDRVVLKLTSSLLESLFQSLHAFRYGRPKLSFWKLLLESPSESQQPKHYLTSSSFSLHQMKRRKTMTRMKKTPSFDV